MLVTADAVSVNFGARLEHLAQLLGREGCSHTSTVVNTTARTKIASSR
jgi:hypothetical protein